MADSSHYVGGSILDHDADYQPTHPLQRLESTNVLDVLEALDAVVVPVVFHRDHELGPTHVEVGDQTAVGAQYRDLSLRRRQAGVDEEQPQVAFPR
jgi:hypothetical protein